MNTDADVWLAFARTFGMLFVVLAVFLGAFYLFKRFSGTAGAKGPGSLIRVLAVHHLSPKEKLVLVNVLNENILIGVTQQNISKLATLDAGSTDLAAYAKPGGAGFAELLSRRLKRPLSKDAPLEPAGQPDEGQG